MPFSHLRNSGKAYSIGGLADGLTGELADMGLRTVVAGDANAPATSTGSSLAEPVLDVPGVVVPAGELDGQLVADAGGQRPGHDGNHHVVVDGKIVQLDQHRDALCRIELDLGCLVGVDRKS